MKNLILGCFFLLTANIAFSQSDTLYFKSGKKAPCKITEISESEIKYKKPDMPEGPVYSISKSSVLKYTFSNGVTELVIPDEMLVEGEHNDILKNRQAIKIHPFSFVNSQVSLAYEKVIKVGMNLDIELGYNNDNISRNDPLNSNYYGVFNSGVYLKPGVKFFLGQDFSVKGLKYAHPLKGRYIKIDLVTSYQNFQGLKIFEYPTGPWPTPATTRTVTSNMNAVAYGGLINYGRQFILGNMFTLEYYVGAGFTALSYSYTNPEYKKIVESQMRYISYGLEGDYISNFHGFTRTPVIGLSFTAGFRLGYILPNRSEKKKQTPVKN